MKKEVLVGIVVLLILAVVLLTYPKLTGKVVSKSNVNIYLLNESPNWKLAPDVLWPNEFVLDTLYSFYSGDGIVTIEIEASKITLFLTTERPDSILVDFDWQDIVSAAGSGNYQFSRVGGIDKIIANISVANGKHYIIIRTKSYPLLKSVKVKGPGYIPICGNNVCEEAYGETAENCVNDCRESICGNNVCEKGEFRTTCPDDCKPADLFGVFLGGESVRGFEDYSENSRITKLLPLLKEMGANNINVPTPSYDAIIDAGLSISIPDRSAFYEIYLNKQFNPDFSFNKTNILVDRIKSKGIDIVLRYGFVIPYIAAFFPANFKYYSDGQKAISNNLSAKINYWEPWNEIQGASFKPQQSLRDFVEIQKEFYERIKEGDDTSTIAFGNLAVGVSKDRVLTLISSQARYVESVTIPANSKVRQYFKIKEDFTKIKFIRPSNLEEFDLVLMDVNENIIAQSVIRISECENYFNTKICGFDFATPLKKGDYIFEITNNREYGIALHNYSAQIPSRIYKYGKLIINNAEIKDKMLFITYSLHNSFLQTAYDYGAKDYFDAVALHPYISFYNEEEADRNGLYVEDILEAKRVMNENNDAGKKIWLTEWSFMNCPDKYRAAGRMLSAFYTIYNIPEIEIANYFIGYFPSDGYCSLIDEKFNKTQMYNVFKALSTRFSDDLRQFPYAISPISSKDILVRDFYNDQTKTLLVSIWDRTRVQGNASSNIDLTIDNGDFNKVYAVNISDGSFYYPAYQKIGNQIIIRNVPVDFIPKLIVLEKEILCGDGKCESEYGESCTLCPRDCGECPTPTPPSGGGSGGGSSGGGGGGRIYSVNLTLPGTTQTAAEKKLEYQTFTFTYMEEEHQIKVLAIEGEKVTLEISSEPIIIEINKGEEKSIDINGDGIDDIVINVNDIIDNKVNLNINTFEIPSARGILVTLIIIILILIIIILIIVGRIVYDREKKKKLRIVVDRKFSESTRKGGNPIIL